MIKAKQYITIRITPIEEVYEQLIHTAMAEVGYLNMPDPNFQTFLFYFSHLNTIILTLVTNSTSTRNSFYFQLTK